MGRLVAGRWMVAAVLVLGADAAVVAGTQAVPGGGIAPAGAAGDGGDAGEPADLEPADLEPADLEPADLEAAVAEQLAARARFGLDADPELVWDLVRGDREAIMTPLQILATPGEAAEVDQRLAAQVRSGAFHALAAAIDEEHFAGTWFDYPGGGLMVAAFTDDDPARTARLLAAAGPYADRARVRVAPRTMAALEDLAGRVYAARDALADRGVAIVSSNAVPPAARVLVEVAGGDEASARLVLDEVVGDVDHDALDVAVVPPGSQHPRNHSPVGGGAHLNEPFTTSAVCSAGAHGYVWFLDLQVPYLVTANHCHQLSTSGMTHLSHGPVFTRVAGVEHPFQGLDVMAMNHGAFTHDQVAPWVLNYSGGPAWALVGVVTPGGTADVYGHAVCRSGRSSGSQCGTVVSTDYQGCGLGGGWRALTVSGQPGDSGGTVFSVPFPLPEVNLAGFHVGACGSTGFYTFQEKARIALGLHGWFTW